MTHNNDYLSHQPTRREFVRASTGLTAAALVAASSTTSLGAAPAPSSLIAPGSTVLFQGDSITDTGRSRDADVASQPNHQPAMGNGYAWLAASQHLVDRPDDELKFLNRGISGNKVFQLAERWQADCLDLKPDVLSILIGVNDYWHMRQGRYDGTVEVYEADYRQLLERTREALPDVKIVICEPFLLTAGTVDEAWREPFGEYRAAAKRVAQDLAHTFVPFQTMFDTATQFAAPEHWAADGVHPSANGAALMAHSWLRAVGA